MKRYIIPSIGDKQVLRYLNPNTGGWADTWTLKSEISGSNSHFKSKNRIQLHVNWESSKAILIPSALLVVADSVKENCLSNR